MSLATEHVNYMRQEKILDPTAAANTHISVLGCGTVGSNAATQLARAGFKKFHLVDMDVVEVHNLPSQAFGIDDIGENKADALMEQLAQITDNLEITTQDFELMGGEQFVSGIIVCAVDNMEMREQLFRLSAKDNREIKLFIDVRMGGNTMKCYAFDPSDKKRCGQYEKTLYTNEEAEDIDCGGRTFAPVGALSGAFITQFVTKHLRDNDNAPYYVEMDFNRFSIVGPIGLPKEAEDIDCGGRTFAPVGALSGAFITQFVTKHLRDNDNAPYYVEMDFNRFSIVGPIGIPKED